jgi:hypothetical protein
VLRKSDGEKGEGCLQNCRPEGKDGREEIENLQETSEAWLITTAIDLRRIIEMIQTL